MGRSFDRLPASAPGVFPAVKSNLFGEGQDEQSSSSDALHPTAGSFQPLRGHALRLAGEHESDAALLDYFTWLQSYGSSTYAGALYADSDGNGMNNWQDWVAGLNPTNALSVLKMVAAAPTNNPPGVVVTWQSVNTRTYYLQSSTNLAAQPAFSTVKSNIVGQTSTTSYTDTTATNVGPHFYRVGVGN
jgi:hypothetical protein